MKKRLLTMLLAAPFTAHSDDTTLTETAIFAGGCFWCIQHDYKDYEEKGYMKSDVGYSGGDVKNPTYENHGNHYEVLRIRFNPDKVSYAQLLNRFWPNIDPTDDGGQFCDRGHSYKSAVFVNSAEQRAAAEASLAKAQELLGDNKIVTPILDASTYYLGEDYHQHYADKNPLRYKYYRHSCGRDKRVKQLWGAREDL